MQTAQTIHPSAQPLQPEWSFPSTVTTQPLAAPVPLRPIAGGGDSAVAPATVARMRWGRLTVVLVGIALIAFGAWTATSQPSTSTKQSSGPATSGSIVSGGGASNDPLGIAAAPRQVTAAPKVARANTATKSQTKANAKAKASRSTRPAASKGAAKRPARHNARTRRGAVAGGGGFAVASANAAAGGGAGAPATPRSGELPMTGLATWIAAILGALALTLGICIHVNAVRLGMTAMLYRRGILLRPVECARLAQGHGMPRLRIALSNLLQRLLEEPAERGEFVAARMAAH